MLGWLKARFGGRREPAPIARRGRMRFVRGRFDAAQTTADNRRHWAYADSLSTDAAGTAAVRQTLRNRARYEVANNSYAKGIVLTLANDTIGAGPRLHRAGSLRVVLQRRQAHAEAEFLGIEANEDDSRRPATGLSPVGRGAGGVLSVRRGSRGGGGWREGTGIHRRDVPHRTGSGHAPTLSQALPAGRARQKRHLAQRATQAKSPLPGARRP